MTTEHTFLEKIYYLKCLSSAIRKRKTGSAEELAVQIGLTRPTLYRYLLILQDIGAEIGFSKSYNSFCFANGFRFSI